MGTKVQIENYLAGHYSMRDLSRETNGSSWPSCFGDNLPNGQFYYGFLPRTVADSHSGYDKDLLKQTMLEHEAVFKNQVYELHRLYRVQRDLMDEVRRKEQFERRIPYEASSSSSPVPSQMKYEDVQRWNGSGLPFANSVCGRPISGAETVQSSPQSAKGKSIQDGASPFQNCYSPKNSEVSESRPAKLRRRMLDLQLPADEYIDTDEVEQFGNPKVSDNVSLSTEKNAKVDHENGKMFLNNAVKTESHVDAPRLDSYVSRSKPLADLNEPIDVEETTFVSSGDFLSRAGSHSTAKHWGNSTKSSIPSKDVPQNSINGSLNGISRNYYLESSYPLESEQQRGRLRSINQGIHPEKGPIPFQPVNSPLGPVGPSPAFLTGDQYKGDSWKVKSGSNIEKSEKNYSVAGYNFAEATSYSRLPNPPGFSHLAVLSKPWEDYASSWGKSNIDLSHKSTSVQAGPFLTSANLSKCPQSSAHSNGFYSNKWNLNCSPGANGSFEVDPYTRNGLYQCGHVPSFGFDSGKNIFKATSSTDVKPVKDMNLNEALPNDTLNNNHKSEDPFSVLPWLKGNAASSTKVETNKKPDSGDYPTSRKILGVPIFENLPAPKKENCALFESSAIENRATEEETGPSGRKVVFDMNLPCELSDSELDTVQEAGVAEKKMPSESASLRNHFDLNSCITEVEEIQCITPVPPDNSTHRKRDTGIDLEAPVILEDDDDDIPPGEAFLTKELEKLPDLPRFRVDNRETELARSAAEAIIAFSSSVNLIQPEAADVEEEEPLHWLADIACSELRDNDGGEERDNNSPKELDDFESMTLRLKECTFEEYFPKPSIPEFPNLEEGSTRVLTTRTRKGQARRGRQRRDFQRDILPGLTTLSRHEVTEDMQTFGGLMKATGYTWHCGPNRRNATRNGCGRGRRRGGAATPPEPVHTLAAPMKQQQIESNSNNTEMSLEDRSLTGWGKTTRRPRRQRLPAGNLTPPLPLS